MYKPFRVGIVMLIMAVLLMVYVTELFRIQVFETLAAEAESYTQRPIKRTVPLPSARGNIYDRNGILLASGRPSYNIMLDRIALLRDPGRNEVILKLVRTTMEQEVPYNDMFPVTRGAPFEYYTDLTDNQRSRLRIYLDYFSLDPEITASDLLVWMRTHYRIDYAIGILEARLIIGVRYELEVRAILMNVAPYVFASDVSPDFVILLEELSFTGVYIESDYVREYHTMSAPHLLGYVRPIPWEQLDYYNAKGYPMDALVGLMGAELAFEDRLRGVAGEQTIEMNDRGTVISVTMNSEPEPGEHVYLTIDIDLQTKVEQELRSHIETINQAREGADLDKIPAGAVVVTGVNTGEILAAASYPTFNPLTLSQDFVLLMNDQTNPLLNRATQGRYNPGSTFKMVTAFAALRYGVISRYSEIFDAGKYTKEPTFQPACWLYNSAGIGHGYVNVVQALECSCNYFFITVSDWINGGGANCARALAKTAQEFGLGISTGLQVPEVPGRLATPEWKLEALNEGWWLGDTWVTSFGQGHNEFTPVQMANYAATIANGGTLHSLSILRSVKSADFTRLIYTHEPEVLNVIEETEYVEILQEGMKSVSRGRRGTARKVFAEYPIRVAAKTGTVQVDEQTINNAVFICYAPADNPEIAISIVVEKGGSGSEVMDIARRIFDYYFISEVTVLAYPYGELIP